MIQKKDIMPVFGAIALVATLGAGQVRAQESSCFTGLAQSIAQKFNIDETQVQSVIDQFHSSKVVNRLDKLVANGKITEAQKQAILDEQKKLMSEYPLDSFKNMTADQRKKAFEAQQAEIKAWAQAQGIDPRYLRHGFTGKGPRR